MEPRILIIAIVAERLIQTGNRGRVTFLVGEAGTLTVPRLQELARVLQLFDRAVEQFDRVVKLLYMHQGLCVAQQHIAVNGSLRSEEHTSELQSPLNLVC